MKIFSNLQESKTSETVSKGGHQKSELGGGSASFNRSVARALGILFVIARSKKPLGFSQLSRCLGLPKGTQHKLLYTLETMNFLIRSTETGKYSIGFAALEIAAGARQQTGNVRAILSPLLQKFVEKWSETCILSILNDGFEIIVDRIDPQDQPVRALAMIGGRQPAHAGAGGLAALATLTDSEVGEMLPGKLEIYTENTVRTKRQLRERLDLIRADGYAIDMEEAYLGVRCVGVALVVGNWPIVMINMTMPVQRASEARLHQLAEPLLVLAEECTKILTVVAPE